MKTRPSEKYEETVNLGQGEVNRNVQSRDRHSSLDSKAWSTPTRADAAGIRRCLGRVARHSAGDRVLGWRTVRPGPEMRPSEAFAIFGTALVVRLIHVWQIRAAPFFGVLMGD